MTDEEVDPERVYKTQLVKKTPQERAWDLLFDKGFSTLTLVVVIYFLYTNLTSSIPVHIKAINDGTAEISRLDREARATDTSRHVEAVKTIIEGQKDEREKAREASEQMERILLNKVNVVSDKIDANRRAIENIKGSE